MTSFEILALIFLAASVLFTLDLFYFRPGLIDKAGTSSRHFCLITLFAVAFLIMGSVAWGVSRAFGIALAVSIALGMVGGVWLVLGEGTERRSIVGRKGD